MTDISYRGIYHKKALYSVNAISVHSNSLMLCSLHPRNVNIQVSIGNDFNLISIHSGILSNCKEA